MRNHHQSSHRATRCVATGARKAPDVRTFAQRARAGSVAASAVLVLWGCASVHNEHVSHINPRIPLPEDALLKPAAAPDCKTDAARAAVFDAKPDADAVKDATLAQRIKLEYERDCYMRAEAGLRERHRRLQLASRATSRAVKRLNLPATN